MSRVGLFLRSVKSLISSPPGSPPSSLVLTCMLEQRKPHWTAWYVSRADVKNDQWGCSHFNWLVGETNYHVLRTGAFPFIKYHVSKRPHEDLEVEDYFYRVLKVLNFGFPTLLYGLAGLLWAKHTETVLLPCGNQVTIYFWYQENRSSLH